MPQIIQITSEAIQAQIRRLLPSQSGFGIDMEASSVITPIIDITPAAEGSQLPQSLQEASSLDSSTSFSQTGGVATLGLTAGFWRFIGSASVKTDTSAAKSADFQLTDGATTKTMFSLVTLAATTGRIITQPFDLTFFLRTGDDVRLFTDANSFISGSYRQVADLQGNLINPTGFSFE